ncbi:MAG: hypothetical protein ABIN36_19940 [Ferruginibacter sp.]
MKSIVITPKTENEFKFLSDLLKKLGVGASIFPKEELEDVGLTMLMKNVDKSKKVSRSEIFKKLAS